MARVISASGFGAARALFLLDLAAAAAVWPATIVVVTGEPGAGPLALVAYPALHLLFAYSLGLYRRDALLDPRRALGRVPMAALLGGIVASVLLALLPQTLGGESGREIAGLMAAAVAGLTLAGCLARILLPGLRRAGLFHRRFLVVGAGRRAWDLAWLLRQEGKRGAYDLAFLHEEAMGELDPRIAADPAYRIFPRGTHPLEAAEAFGADQIVVAADERRGLPMQALLACRTAGFPVSEYLRCLEREIGRIDMKRIELGWLLYADGFGASGLDHALKRLLDIAAALMILLLTFPFLGLAALAVKLQDGGPVLYRQNRVTLGGRVFPIMKLRTMLVDAEKAGATWAQAGDPRVTAIGRFLRRTRLDELPQLFNVLRGDMSLVGPRPERPEFIAKLAEALPLYDERHRVKAGLTGWAQVNYPYGASLDDARSKLSYDLYYVKNFNLLFDLRILLQTLRVVLWPGKGAVR
jgi:sugar transferase (PEP-CTERM system associated)